jgi:hypothetical protein
MDERKVAQVCADYETFLREKGRPTALDPERMSDHYAHRHVDQMPVRVVAEHMLFVAQEIPRMMAAGQTDKAMRWLGWLQGAIWGMGLETLDEAKKRNAADPEPAAKPGGPFGPVEDWLAKVPSIRETKVGGVSGIEFIAVPLRGQVKHAVHVDDAGFLFQGPEIKRFDPPEIEFMEVSLGAPDAGGEPMQELVVETVNVTFEPVVPMAKSTETCAGCDQVGGPLVLCVTCDREKVPMGRSAPMDSIYCEHECDGHYHEPTAGQLWPGERWGDSLPCIHGTQKEGD